MFFELPPPTPNRIETRYRTALNEREYLIFLRYNSRSEHYTFDLDLTDGTPIVTGVTVRPWYNFLARARRVETPPGQIFVAKSNGSPIAPKFNEIGDTAHLYYWDGETDEEGASI